MTRIEAQNLKAGTTLKSAVMTATVTHIGSYHATEPSYKRILLTLASGKTCSLMTGDPKTEAIFAALSIA